MRQGFTRPLLLPVDPVLFDLPMAAWWLIRIINLTCRDSSPYSSATERGISLKRIVLFLLAIIASPVFAGSMPLVCPDELSSWIKAQKPCFLVDIQSEEQYLKHHYDRSMAAGGSPRRLAKIARQVGSAKGKVVVVSSTGGADAQQAAELLVRFGVPRSRLLILTGGMDAAAKKVGCDCCRPGPVPEVGK